MDTSGPLWSIMTILGPLRLIAVIAWAALRNRTSRAKAGETEFATRELYREADIAHREAHERGN